MFLRNTERFLCLVFSVTLPTTRIFRFT